MLKLITRPGFVCPGSCRRVRSVVGEKVRWALALIVMVALGTLVAPLTAGAQPAAKVPRIGVLHPGSLADVAQFVDAFRQGLREHGYEEGKNIVVERRFGDSRPERMAEVAAELVRLKVDVIVVSSDVAIAAVKRQTQTIPIVMAISTDPVATGFVSSLAHPGGTVTGLSNMSAVLGAKRLELLNEVVPGLSRVAIMWNPDARGALLDYKETEEAARSRRMQLQSVEVSQAGDFERAFAALKTERADAVIVAPTALMVTNRGQIASLALKYRLPSMFGAREMVDAGGLMAYGPSLAEMWRRSVTYIEKILKGAKPGDLPVEQPTKFELVINVKTAKELGLTLPPSLLRRADEVIQ